MSTRSAIPFEWTPGTKAAPPKQLENGDLVGEGWFVRFDEIDREGDRWDGTSRLLIESIAKFVRGKGPLVHHHKFDVPLGHTTDYEVVPGVGVKVRFVINHQPPGSPWRHLYEAAKKGALSRLSSGGLFRRKATPDGPVLVDADFLELSLCSQSVGRGTSWKLLSEKAAGVPEGKGLNAYGDVVDAPYDAELGALTAQVNRLEADFLQLRLRRALERMS